MTRNHLFSKANGGKNERGGECWKHSTASNRSTRTLGGSGMAVEANMRIQSPFSSDKTQDTWQHVHSAAARIVAGWRK